jgi:cell division protein FtsB
MSNENKPSLMKRWPVLVVGGMLLLAFLYSLFGDVGILSTLDLRAKQKRLIAENSRLRTENEQLRGEVEKLRSNPSYIEEIARRELGLMGKKEIVIPLDRNKDAASPAATGGGTNRP